MLEGSSAPVENQVVPASSVDNPGIEYDGGVEGEKVALSPS